ncbi:uncharacterized protein TRUGW13939_08796 [Talaromyces rugulosus]|uniref:Uncharacterized protein n=1 Tax=Talaromyces rugulosus TaxID=121627 RepID=A0A7H8R5I1_TALRU|nr:uncharacterized protein TRUGW13939_08796 [Talaromyces rugulosus]QKX61644.1 hypothetical protein TRUGW13939_08796 [Talaromyces rugulosus]
MWAAEWDAPRVVDILLQHGADVNVRDKLGWMALFWAAKGRAPLVLEVLLQAGADRTVRDTNGLSALLVAETKGTKHAQRMTIVMRRPVFLFPWQDSSLLKLTGLEKTIFTIDWDVKEGWDWARPSCIMFNEVAWPVNTGPLVERPLEGEAGPDPVALGYAGLLDTQGFAAGVTSTLGA